MLRTASFLFLAALALPIPVAAQAPPLLLTWGSQGNGDGQFSEPRGLAVDASGNVYVTDFFPHSRIQVFDANGVFLRKWGTQGSGPGQLFSPQDIAIDGNGNVYIIDSNRVLKFTADGAFLTQWGSSGTADGQFDGASGIAIDVSNNVYVVDNSDCRVQKFTGSGTFLLKWEACTFGPGVSPKAIEAEPAGTVLVTILGQSASIQRYTATGNFVGEVTRSVYEPYSVAVDAGGRIHVADGSAARVLAFTSAGALIEAWGSAGSGPGQFGVATGIALGPGGEIYVSDRWNYRIQKYGSLSTPTLRSTWGKVKTTYR